MRRLVPTPVLVVVALCLVAAAGWISQTMRVESAVGRSAERLRAHGGPRAMPAKSCRRPEPSGLAGKVEAGIRSLSLREVLARLPDGKLDQSALVDALPPGETALLLQRLGALQGEEALDLIVGRYPAQGGATAAAMVHAILGWMEVDPDGALAALRHLFDSESGEVIPAMQWKGEPLVAGFI